MRRKIASSSFYPSSEVYDEWKKNRYKVFDKKIDSFKDHPKYSWLRAYADDAKYYNEGSGYFMIKAEDFIKRIETFELSYIRDWLDGKNNLEWRTKNE